MKIVILAGWQPNMFIYISIVSIQTNTRQSQNYGWATQVDIFKGCSGYWVLYL